MSGENIPESAKAKHYKELLVWQRSMALAKLAYQLTDHFPPDEKFGLTSLIRRTAVSIPSSMARAKPDTKHAIFCSTCRTPMAIWLNSKRNCCSASISVSARHPMWRVL